jgi:hypothetical protein
MLFAPPNISSSRRIPAMRLHVFTASSDLMQIVDRLRFARAKSIRAFVVINIAKTTWHRCKVYSTIPQVSTNSSQSSLLSIAGSILKVLVHLFLEMAISVIVVRCNELQKIRILDTGSFLVRL